MTIGISAPAEVEIETEAAVLGAVLGTPSWAYTLMERLAVEDFARPIHQVVYRLILDVASEGHEPGFLAVSQAAQRQHNVMVLRYLPELVTRGQFVTAGQFDAQLAEVSGYAYIRRMSSLGLRLAHLSAGASIDEIESMRDQAKELLDQAGAPNVEDPDAVTWDELYRRSMEAAENPTNVAVVPVPFVDLAELLHGGLRAGNLVLVGARPAVGKSLAATEIARHAAIKGVRTMLVTLEMDHHEVSARLIAATAKVELRKTLTMTERRDVLTDADWDRLAKGYETAAEAGHLLTVVDPSTAFTVASLERRLVAMERKGTPYGLVVLDYLQLLKSLGEKAENRQAEVQKMSRDLKLLAKRFGIPIVVLAQLNRGPEQRADHVPMMADLRESGGLENDANVVILLHRPDVYDKESPRAGEIDLIVAKNRNGPTGTVTAVFQGHYALISNFEPAE